MNTTMNQPGTSQSGLHQSGRSSSGSMTDQLDRDETNDLISSDKVEDTAVCNTQGDKIGTIKHLMIEKVSGQVAYAVLSFGGFLGIGEKYHAVPWQVLRYDTSRDAYVADLDRDRLERAPSYDISENPFEQGSGYGRQLDDYYRL